MRFALPPLLLAAAACAVDGPPPPPAALAGCYEVRFSRYARLIPTFALPVDSAPGAAVLRVWLDTVPARDAWESPAYVARFPKIGSLQRMFWVPRADGGMRITVAYIDDGNTLELTPTPSGGFLGTDDAWGMKESGGGHARAAAKRVSCENFTPGFDAGSRLGS